MHYSQGGYIRSPWPWPRFLPLHGVASEVSGKSHGFADLGLDGLDQALFFVVLRSPDFMVFATLRPRLADLLSTT